MKLPLYIALFVFGVAIAQSICFYRLLPDIVGSHFDISGKVNGTTSKMGYFIVYFVSLAITSSFTILIPLIFKYVPTSMINLPHKAYWLSDERREESIRFLNVHLSWFGVATMLLMVIIFHLTFLANLSPIKNLSAPAPWALLATFVIFTIWWTVVLLKRFPKPS
ncbi:MAG: DUF1648 domain-containing protein [Pseudanabaena sp.]|jgi:uncharacterized membrane protein|nr:DUF1648 domain-containing protein [Pseudanabaena sp. M085S1SP2A07QC]MCA6595057.1 DUF1648 domain-containing protein [Pseudanabaena sp. M046S1SP1A06QC]